MAAPLLYFLQSFDCSSSSFSYCDRRICAAAGIKARVRAAPPRHKGLADHFYGVPTPELDIFATLRVVNPADEELCFRRGSATVKHRSTSTALAKGAVQGFCVAAEGGARDVGVWPQDVRDGVAAERLRGELQLQVSLELVDKQGMIEVAVDCRLNQDFTRSYCQSEIFSFYEGY